MAKLLKKLFTIGVYSEQEFQIKRNIIFVNQACFILLLCAILVVLGNIYFGFYHRCIVAISSIPVFIIALFLQSKKQYLMAKQLMVFTAFALGFCSTLIFGIEAKTQYYIFASFTLGMVVFHKRLQHIFLFILHFTGFIFLTVYLKENAPLIIGQDSVSLSYFHIPLIFICCFVTLSEYVLHYRRYEQRVDELMDSITKHSDLLIIEKNKFEVQADILRQTNNELISEIGKKEAAQKDLVASNLELQQFAYVASHDLKEPLRTIGSFTQLMRRRLKDKFDTETEEYYSFIVDGVKRMSNLLDDLLALSKIDKESEITEVDMEDVLALNLLNLGNRIKRDNGEVIVHEMPVIKANKSQMVQLFQNLISNGLKFKRDVPPKVEISHQEQEHFHLFCVKDNGIGIPLEYQEKNLYYFPTPR